MLYGTGKYTYELVEEWAKLPEGWSFVDVSGLAIDSQDRVYVFIRSSFWGKADHPVMVFDREGNLLTTWGEGFFKRPHGIYISPDDLVYCTDDESHTVYKFTLDGKLLLTLGNKDQPSDTGYVREQGYMSIKRGGPPFNRPTGVAVSSSGEIYVSDGYGNARVHKFTPDGTLLFSWGEPGTGPGQFRISHDVWVDKQEHIWICDRENSRIQIFNAEGKLLNQWTDNLNRPNDIFIDDEEAVYVCGGRGVRIFTIDGKLQAYWHSLEQDSYDPATLFVASHGIAVDSRGDLYVGQNSLTMTRSDARGGIDIGAKAVLKFARRA